MKIYGISTQWDIMQPLKIISKKKLVKIYKLSSKNCPQYITKLEKSNMIILCHVYFISRRQLMTNSLLY